MLLSGDLFVAGRAVREEPGIVVWHVCECRAGRNGHRVDGLCGGFWFWRSRRPSHRLRVYWDHGGVVSVFGGEGRGAAKGRSDNSDVVASIITMQGNALGRGRRRPDPVLRGRGRRRGRAARGSTKEGAARADAGDRRSPRDGPRISFGLVESAGRRPPGTALETGRHGRPDTTTLRGVGGRHDGHRAAARRLPIIVRCGLRLRGLVLGAGPADRARARDGAAGRRQFGRGRRVLRAVGVRGCRARAFTILRPAALPARVAATAEGREDDTTPGRLIDTQRAQTGGRRLRGDERASPIK
mmetsp:Transcript_4313/g.10805  ORF Transcript_4313/g.10805 Transcript_4313/m.10805 type:complete len:299 (-) Transcript_4313:18-914(-)